MRDNGIFVTLEGIDGSGKTTHVKYIKELFEKEGYVVVTTREPGGTPMAEKIRNVLLDDWIDEEIDPLTEALLFSASRKQHLENYIKPHLAMGHVVISDRYVDTMIAYQGAGRGSVSDVDQLCNLVCGDNGWPDFTIYFDVNAEVAQSRTAKRADENRLDKEAISFKERALACYNELVKKHRNRYIRINANRDVEGVRRQLEMYVANIVKMDLSWKSQQPFKKG